MQSHIITKIFHSGVAPKKIVINNYGLINITELTESTSNAAEQIRNHENSTVIINNYAVINKVHEEKKI